MVRISRKNDKQTTYNGHTLGSKCHYDNNMLHDLVRKKKASYWHPYRNIDDCIKKAGL